MSQHRRSYEYFLVTIKVNKIQVWAAVIFIPIESDKTSFICWWKVVNLKKVTVVFGNMNSWNNKIERIENNILSFFLYLHNSELKLLKIEI